MDDKYVQTTFHSHSKNKEKGKEVWEDDATVAVLSGLLNVGRRRDRSLFLSVSRAQVDPSNEVLTPDHQKLPRNADTGIDTNNFPVQTQPPTQPTKERTFMDMLLGDENFALPPLVPEDANSYSSPSRAEVPPMSLVDNSAAQNAEMRHLGQVCHSENIVSGSSAGSGLQFLEFPVYTSASSIFAEPVAIEVAGDRALVDPDQEVAYRLWHQSFEDLKNQYALDIKMAYCARLRPDTNDPGYGKIAGFPQIQHSSGRPGNIHNSGHVLNNRNSELTSLLEQIKNPRNHSMRLIHIKGHVPSLSVDPAGSRFIQKMLGTATTGEITMLYKEIMPHVCTLARDAFANYVVQKLLDHGPPIDTRKLIGNLFGQVIGLSLDIYGCRVIQKVFEISEIDQQIEIAKELGSNLLKCVCNQHAWHVINKCIECVPTVCIGFIYTSFCGKAKMLSAHPSGCRIIQKVLEFCKDPQILHALVKEIVESANELSVDQFGNYVVQYIVEHGGPRSRGTIVRKFAGQIVHMIRQKHSSNVVEKCLIHGSHHDRQLIINETLYARGARNADHLLGMMIHRYANYVVQTMMGVADEWQFKVITDVVSRNVGKLVTYTHGRHVIMQAEKLVNARAPLRSLV